MRNQVIYKILLYLHTVILISGAVTAFAQDPNSTKIQFADEAILHIKVSSGSGSFWTNKQNLSLSVCHSEIISPYIAISQFNVLEHYGFCNYSFDSKEYKDVPDNSTVEFFDKTQSIYKLAGSKIWIEVTDVSNHMIKLFDGYETILNTEIEIPLSVATGETFSWNEKMSNGYTITVEVTPGKLNEHTVASLASKLHEKYAYAEIDKKLNDNYTKYINLLEPVFLSKILGNNGVNLQNFLTSIEAVSRFNPQNIKSLVGRYIVGTTYHYEGCEYIAKTMLIEECADGASCLKVSVEGKTLFNIPYENGYSLGADGNEDTSNNKIIKTWETTTNTSSELSVNYLTKNIGSGDYIDMTYVFSNNILYNSPPITYLLLQFQSRTKASGYEVNKYCIINRY